MICFICKSCHSNTNVLVRHLKLIHGLCPGRTLRLKCGEARCAHVSGTFSGFRKHMKRVHEQSALNDEVLEINRCGSNDLLVDVNAVVPVMQPDLLVSGTSSSLLRSGEYVHNMCASVVAELQSVGIGQGNVHNLVCSLEEVVNGIQDQIKETVLSCLSDGQIVEKVEQTLGHLDNPFTQLNSVAKRRQYFSKKWGVVAPVKKLLGSRFDNRWNKNTGTFDQVLVSDTLAYVPLLLTLQSVFKQSSIIDMFTSVQSSSNLYSDLRDGAYFMKHPLFSKDIPSLQIQLFYDDFEPCNPLGSKKGAHKLGAIYFTLRNFPPRYNSCLANIHLCMLFHTQDIKKYGFATILEPLVNDLKILETDGIDIPGLGGLINGSIFQVTGDNLGLHGLFGYVESFSAKNCCRFCLTEREDYQKVFSEDHPNMRLRTKELHSDHCQLIKASPEQGHVYGVKSECLLNSLKYFHIVDNYAVDVMHDILEGVAQFEVKLTLKYIAEKSISFKEITLEASDDRIKSFNYGYIERRNQPSALKLEDASNDLGLYAIQSWCLLRNIPLMFGDVVERNDRHWNLLLLLLQIVNIVFSPYLTKGMTVYLKYLIVEHHQLFKQLFPGKNLLPKHHTMIHYPRCIQHIGPIIHVWCMRYEGKHNYFKKQKKCFKNLTWSLAKKHQNYMAYHWERCSKERLIVGPGKKKPVSSFPAKEQLSCILSLSFTKTVRSVKWVKYYGTEFRTNLVICSAVLNDMPVFQKIKAIVVKDDNVFLIVTKLETVCFDEHVYAFSVSVPREELHSVIDVSVLAYHKPFDLQMAHNMEDNKWFIVPYCHFL
ncbi:hypothetical protein N1851_029941 [Merluccius polli]|uniref:C2H2-type domain-containing protein n=1 Tax=Merluccius polli TaxID=89951 RepID=A0AA47NQD7_MERPO|nr:hypothetical protein N1851_029941 [Merluccius polli]